MPATHDDDTRMDALAPGASSALEAEGGGPAGDAPGAAAHTRPTVHGRVAKPRKPKKGKRAKAEAAGGKGKPAKAGTSTGSERRAEAGAADEASDARGRRKARKPGHARRVLFALVAFVLVAILACTGLFCWQKWMRYDDAADIQGVWKVRSTGDTIVFDGRNLKITKGIAYEYRLDTDGKTITYSFGDLEGGGRYYFGADRGTLVIMDGDGHLDALAEVGFISEDVLADRDASDETTVLDKVSGDTSAEPSGTATGIGTGAATGEREYVVKPESSSSSGSKKKDDASGSSSSNRAQGSSSAASPEDRGFVDEDGDGYDDATGLEYGEFLEYQSRLQGQSTSGNGDDAAMGFVDEDEDGYDDITGLEYEDFMQAQGAGGVFGGGEDEYSGLDGSDEGYDGPDPDGYYLDGESGYDEEDDR